MISTRHIGTAGEQEVVAYLRAKSYEIVAQQWHCPFGEIDIIAATPDVLAFVEVKTRSASNWDGDGILAISRQKQKRLINCALCYGQRYPDREAAMVRFDIALVERNANHLRLHTYLAGAFDA